MLRRDGRGDALKVCPVVLPGTSKRAGVVCGRKAVASVAPGQSRCGYHTTELARRRAVAELRELRALPPEDGGKDHDQEARRDVDADGTTWTWEDDGAAAAE